MDVNIGIWAAITNMRSFSYIKKFTDNISIREFITNYRIIYPHLKKMLFTFRLYSSKNLTTRRFINNVRNMPEYRPNSNDSINYFVNVSKTGTPELTPFPDLL